MGGAPGPARGTGGAGGAIFRAESEADPAASLHPDSVVSFWDMLRRFSLAHFRSMLPSAILTRNSISPSPQGLFT